jgi:hypothetical protein
MGGLVRVFPENAAFKAPGRGIGAPKRGGFPRRLFNGCKKRLGSEFWPLIVLSIIDYNLYTNYNAAFCCYFVVKNGKNQAVPTVKSGVERF